MDDINQILDKIAWTVFKVHPKKVEQLSDSTNYVYKLELPDLIVIIRVSKEPNVDQLEKEKWELEQARLRGIPSPKVLAVDMQDKFPYMVMEYIKGVDGVVSDADHVWRELGRYGVTIHSIPAEGFGDHMFEPGKFRSNRKDFIEFLDYNISCLTEDDQLTQMGVLTQVQSNEISVLFTDLKHKGFKFGLNHGDLALRNTVADADGKIFLFDYGSSEINIIPHFDIIEVLQTSFKLDYKDPSFIGFLQGLGINAEQFSEMKPDIDVFLLLRAIDKLRWAIVNKPSELDKFIGNIEKIQNYLRNEGYGI